jgi:hypothetical protein
VANGEGYAQGVTKRASGGQGRRPCTRALGVALQAQQSAN